MPVSSERRVSTPIQKINARAFNRENTLLVYLHICLLFEDPVWYNVFVGNLQWNYAFLFCYSPLRLIVLWSNRDCGIYWLLPDWLLSRFACLNSRQSLARRQPWSWRDVTRSSEVECCMCAHVYCSFWVNTCLLFLRYTRREAVAYAASKMHANYATTLRVFSEVSHFCCKLCTILVWIGTGLIS